ncbi:hypothetical protein A2814_03530 [Candidatus Nomurabacteria bacterium RIFCSPHIGHO2_01_FULL_38_19]|uniref:FCP1 homology domain-containing protein n=1 Tax=Candidatus Nomurabacteria bacterium RIFCSPHIGHO2_01_FULL_38_19 TaxID=1801732 RepID=A0A1F6UTZ7_9BACT|nr:MAG: hypothetical protein A2814_03530 [Candidatus Nomurabacteria bacterium RIFCSPHIGHO2_01_FULL_38_19]
MKYIFDFDDVLFHTTRRRQEHLYPFLEKMGVAHEKINEYYNKIRGQQFSVKNLLKYFSLKEEMYEEIMRESKIFLNKDLVKLVKKAGKNNCYIITYGDKEFQLDKIKRAGVDSLFFEIIVVPTDEKKEIIEKICAKHADEKVIFIDDKAKHFEKLDFKKYPNLKTILYTGQDLSNLTNNVQ